jgi:hypothetical protein
MRIKNLEMEEFYFLAQTAEPWGRNRGLAGRAARRAAANSSARSGGVGSGARRQRQLRRAQARSLSSWVHMILVIYLRFL